ncbi:putative Pre mRNA splicing factor 38 [Trypanosoma vivax]|uniref:Pre-mRNA-splicing factor 38 n=1 Tax=Trypanosoma vivax (strain Y486) TaxID=1055687 RepID=G0TR81_TRYVY|nr:hypothetical protein TRVL_07819 [Trypanosoma vivax]KAH8611897.1 putative Pre mRNA splicing factor 38 [Trypanosoma vivax]CCC46445.1 conserved hypothetical protein [Trypanosoma vivax Y486]
MSVQRRIAWNLKGRSAVASIDPPTRHRILQSNAMLSCAHRSLLAVLETLISVEYVGGLSGPLKKPELFVCLIVRILQIAPSPSVVLAMLQQDVHKYLRVAALFIIRLIGNAAMMQEALRIGWMDYRKIRVYCSDAERGDAMREGKSAESNEGENRLPYDCLEAHGAPSYGIMCVDEITDCLFRTCEEQKNTGGGGGHTWLGLQFPPIL